MVLMAFLMAESSSLLRAPLRNWSGWCFTTRLFRGLDVGGETGVGVGVGSGAGSGVGEGVEVAVALGVAVGVADTRSVLRLGVGVVPTDAVSVGFTCCASKTVFSRPYIEIKIRMIEAPVISFRISLQLATF